MKKTALFLFMLFAFAMKAQEMVLLGEATDIIFIQKLYENQKGQVILQHGSYMSFLLPKNHLIVNIM